MCRRVFFPVSPDGCATQDLSVENTLAALRDRISCLMYLVRIAEQSLPSIRKIVVRSSLHA